MTEDSPHQQLAESTHFGRSQVIPEIFEALLDEDAARVIPAASPPATCDELAECEVSGLVHTIPRGREVIEICNCCGDCCAAWPANRAAWSKFVEPTRFLAVVDPDDCIACENCNDR